MKIFLNLAVLIWLVLFVSGTLFASPNLNYKATINENSDTVHVKIKLENIDQEIQNVKFGLPVLSDTEEIQAPSYYDFMENLKAYTEEQTLDISKKDSLFTVTGVQNPTYVEYDVKKQINTMGSFYTEAVCPELYFNDELGSFRTNYLFLPPENIGAVDSIHINFDTPSNWEVFAPFKKVDQYYAVEYDEVVSLLQHFSQSAFYMGETEFSVEKKINGTTHKIGRLKGDDNEWELTSRAEAENYINKVSKSYSNSR